MCDDLINTLGYAALGCLQMCWDPNQQCGNLVIRKFFASAQISASFPIPTSLRVLRHRFLCLHDRGRVDELGKTPISQVQSVSGLPIYSTLKLWLNKNNISTASVRKSVVD